MELHGTGFGCVLVANINQTRCIGFALGAQWPMPVLEVHRIDRDAGTTEPISAPSGLVAPDIKGILDVFKAQRENEKGARNVDR